MRDFLDNLIHRHTDVTPQIMPRLLSLFEPEVTRGGLNAGAPDNNVLEMEETVFTRPSGRTNQTAPSHREPGASLPIAEITQPTPFLTSAQAMQSMTAPAVGWQQQTQPLEAMVMVNERPKPSVLQEKERREGTNSPVQISAVSKSKTATDDHPVQAALSKERIGKVRSEHRSPDFEATREDHTSVRERAHGPLLTPSLGERAGVRMEADSTGDPLIPFTRQGRLTQERLRPSVTLIAPAIPSVTGPQGPVSQPEPVINVTIGRIEVRATMSPQKPAPKPQNPTPVMGLEEYLRRRSGHDR